MNQEQEIKLPRWRRILAMAVLLGGLGWVIGGFWKNHAAPASDLEVVLARGLHSAAVELWICIRDDRGEDIWMFRGKMQKPVSRFRPRIAKGRYELYAEVRIDGRQLPSARLSLTLPGNAVRVEVSESETRILH